MFAPTPTPLIARHMTTAQLRISKSATVLLKMSISISNEDVVVTTMNVANPSRLRSKVPEAQMLGVSFTQDSLFDYAAHLCSQTTESADQGKDVSDALYYASLLPQLEEAYLAEIDKLPDDASTPEFELPVKCAELLVRACHAGFFDPLRVQANGDCCVLIRHVLPHITYDVLRPASMAPQCVPAAACAMPSQ